MSKHTCQPDPIIGKCPCQMNIIEWCDWEPRARAEFYREKAEAKKAAKRVKRANRVELVHGYLTALGATDGITFDEARTIAERIDQTYYPEAWQDEHNKETA